MVEKFYEYARFGEDKDLDTAVQNTEREDLEEYAEPLFIGLDATVQIHPVMTAEDLEKATPAIEQGAQRYG